MATAISALKNETRDDGFFLISAALMALVLVSGFSFQLGMGRSTFGAPLLVHLHALAYFGWVVIYVAQSWLGTRGRIALHRRLGWFSLFWCAAMVVLGFAIVVFKVRGAAAPSFFQPQHFLIANPLVVVLFAGLTAAAVVERRRTDWHRRLHLSAMAALTAPGFGRLLPMPLLIPYAYHAAAFAALAFPVAGMIRDWRRDGRLHPAWWWGVGATLATMLLTEAIVFSPFGDAIYAAVTAGTPGAAVAPFEFGVRSAPLIPHAPAAI